MSTVDISAENVLTSKSEDMDVKNATDELKIIYSHVNSEDTLKPDQQIESVNVLESLLPIVSANDSSNDRLGLPNVDNDAFEDNSVAKNTSKTSSDSKNEMQCPKISKSEVKPDRIEETNAIKTTNLTQSTFGLISEPQRTVKDLNNSLSKVQNDVLPIEDIVMEVETVEPTDKTCSIELDESLLTGEKKETTGRIEMKNTVNSLSCLATEYASSDSGEDERAPSPCEVITIVDDCDYKTQNKTEYRIKTVDVDSTSEDTDSDSGDESDSSDTDSDSDSDSEIEEGRENVARSQPSRIKKTKNEFEDLPPIEELKITVPEELCDRLGEVSGIVEQLVIVRPISGKPTLNLDSIIFLEKGHRVLGRVFDVFGQVADPHYCIRFNSQDHIKQCGIVVGMEVFYSPNTEHTSLVFLHELVKLKGIDVSGEDDIEPPEFSDDEEERAYNQLQRQKQRQKPGVNERHENSDAEGLPQKRQCPERQRNPWSSDWQTHNYNNARSNRNFGQGPPRWSAENSQNSFQNSFNLQNQNQHPPNQYGPPSNSFNTPQYQFNPYNNPYQQNNMYASPNPRYAFGRPPAFRSEFNNYGPGLYRPSQYPPPAMSWAPQPPPPPPLPPSM